MAYTRQNKLDFIPSASEGQQFLPTFDWRTIGAVFALGQKSDDSILTAAKVSGRCAFTVREGYDPIDASSTGRVVEGSGDLGLSLRRGTACISLTAGNLGYRGGLDDPLASAQTRVGEASVPSLKFTVAKEYSDDCFAAVSWDLAQKKPEVAVGWAGDTFSQQAAVVVHADPVLRTYKVSASVAFPGPDWRDTYLDEEKGVLEYPADDGARHRLWATHTVKDRQWGYRTRVGGAFDLGRILNNLAELVDNKIQPRIPPMVWRVPLLSMLYDLLVPGQDEEQYRYNMRGWDLEAAHEFGVKGAQVALAKNFKHATLRGGWHTGANEASLTYKRSGVGLTARLGRQEGGAGGWGRPSLMLQVEPLGLL